MKRLYNRWFPYWRLCHQPWCLRGQVYRARCYRHQPSYQRERL